MSDMTSNEQSMRDALAKLGRSVLDSWEKKNAEIAHLRAALDRFGMHPSKCKRARTWKSEDCDCGLSAALSGDSSPVETSDNERMRNTLVKAGYTDCGGELWKPPLGPQPAFLDENPRLSPQKALGEPNAQ